jgi:hypothetical protein
VVVAKGDADALADSAVLPKYPRLPSDKLGS